MPEPRTPFVLASGSPRRRELLRRAGLSFEVVPPRVEEKALAGEAPEALAVRLAAEKALEVAVRLAGHEVGAAGRPVLGADTVVVIDGEVLGKPDDPEHALQLLARLVGRTHRVITGIALVRDAAAPPETRAVASRVTFRDASREELAAYVATGEPLDKAGAYGLQGEGRRFVARVEGSESNVIGLPMEETLALLERALGGRRA